MEGIEWHKERTSVPENTLYPIFLKLHSLELLIVGGGEVGYEKLHFLLKNSPDAKVTVVAREVSDDVRALTALYSDNVRVIERAFEEADLKGKDLVILATDDKSVNARIRDQAREKGLLVNVADTPDLCDFYLGSIVSKGTLKVAISSNGKSPTLTKRLRQLFETTLPDDISELADRLGQIRDGLEGDLERKVRYLNQVTEDLLKEKT